MKQLCTRCHNPFWHYRPTYGCDQCYKPLWWGQWVVPVALEAKTSWGRQ